MTARKASLLPLGLVLVAGCAVPVSPLSSSTRGGDPAEVRAALARAGEAERGPINGLGRAMAFVVARGPAGAN